jgi:hydrogenase nickel incorporation protein HypA/HybF
LLIKMHELSVMAQVVESVTKELEGKHIIKVEVVRLEIGELTMLGKEQLKFAWGILTGDGPLKGSRLTVVKKPAVIECLKCGYRGGARHSTGLGSHIVFPYIACPKCGGEVKVVGGRECIIRSLKATMNDEKKGAERRAREDRGPLGPTGPRSSGPERTKWSYGPKRAPLVCGQNELGSSTARGAMTKPGGPGGRRRGEN